MEQKQTNKKQKQKKMKNNNKKNKKKSQRNTEKNFQMSPPNQLLENKWTWNFFKQNIIFQHFFTSQLAK